MIVIVIEVVYKFMILIFEVNENNVVILNYKMVVVCINGNCFCIKMMM